jgi:predicted NBD/HSP70 family sugar kinase
VTPAKPSLDLLRSLTDEHVLRALMEERRLTRAQLAVRTGISKPTVSDSVHRLTAAGLLRDTGERTTGRGRVGSYYALDKGLGSALVMSIAPEGIVAEMIDVYGEVISRGLEHLSRSARPAQVTRGLRAAASRVQTGTGAPSRLAVVSAADPVDRFTGRLVQLPDAPFLLGELSPADALAQLVGGPITVDNDVHWAARAERQAAGPGELDDFAYVYLGEGLGCAIVSDGEVRRGHRGIAGEIAHVVTRGPHGRAIQFTDVFAELHVRHAASTAVDSTALLRRVQAGGGEAQRVRSALAEAICGVLAAVVAFADPQLVVIGGMWGPHPTILESVSREFERLPRHVPVRAAQVTVEPSLAGARHQALQDLRAAILGQCHAVGLLE